MTPLQGPHFWVARFGKTRRRLYWLTLSFNAFVVAFLLAAAVLGEGVVPCCRWLPEFIGFVIPGLPANLPELWARHFWPVTLLIPVGIVVALANRMIKAEENECTFQARRYNSRINLAPCTLKPVFSARCIAWISPVFPPVSAVLLAVSVAYLSVTVTVAVLWAPAETGAPECGLKSSDAVSETPSRCHATGLRRLDADDAVNVIIVASRVRNETGLLVGKGEWYEARHLTSQGWRDGDIRAEPWGIRFSGLTQLFAWLVEWFRPYPEGGWFQLVGRVGTGRTVFPVLGTDPNSGRVPYQFRVPGDGELILLVNDVWYSNNSGFMTIKIRRLSQCAPPACRDSDGACPWQPPACRPEEREALLYF